MTSSLRARPLRRPCRPAYPSRLAVHNLPALLNTHQPPPWLGRREIAGALATMLTVGGCSGDRGLAKAGGEDAALVAPVFNHGRGLTWGRGRLLGLPAGTPVHLSEDEAVTVIAEELAAVGIDLSRRNVTWPDVVVDGYEQIDGMDWESGVYNEGLDKVSGPLIVDGIDPQHGIAIEYINADDDFYRLGGSDWMQDKDVREQSRCFGDEMGRRKLSHHLGVFYDPLCMQGMDYNNSDETDVDAEADLRTYTEQEALERSKAFLRLQVKDFVDWLNGQGVI